MRNIIDKIVFAFFGVESYAELKRQGLVKGTSFSALFSAEWILVILVQALVTVLLHRGWVESEIFKLLWIGNIVIAWVIVLWSGKNGNDPTLMEGSRRLTDLAYKKSFLGGALMEIGYFIGLVVWAETSSFYIFFRKRMGPLPIRIAIFIAVSAVKMFLWTKVYIFGDNILNIIWNCFQKIVT